MRRITALLGLIMIITAGNSLADEVVLKNGDRITGEIFRVTDKIIRIKAPAMGNVTVKREFVASYNQDGKVQQAQVEQPEEKKSPWKRKISLGYSRSDGNTEDSEGRLKVQTDRKGNDNEFNFLATAYYSSSNGQMDARKFYGKTRYAYSFGEEKEWFHFYKFEGEQDRFANVDYRLTPSTGIGYWFSDELPLKATVDLGIGFEHTNFRGSADSTNEAILVPHGYLEWQALENLLVSEDFTAYPSLADLSEYRIKSETALSTKITNDVSAKLSYILEYDAAPSGTAKKTDSRLISSLEYEF